MKQIKTIKRQLDASAEFDNEVNAAIAEGWTLTRREVLSPMEGQSRIFWHMLYAELEREIITEAERNCENCRYCETLGGMEPCHSCDASMSNWELMP